MRRHRFSFGIPEVGSGEKRKSHCFAVDLWPDRSSKWARPVEQKRLGAGRSQRPSLMPSLTLRQEFIKARQLMSEGNSANHLPELWVPWGPQAGLRMRPEPEPVQAGSPHRSEESADTWEQPLRKRGSERASEREKLSPLYASRTVLDSSESVASQNNWNIGCTCSFTFFCAEKHAVYTVQ